MRLTLSIYTSILIIQNIHKDTLYKYKYMKLQSFSLQIHNVQIIVFNDFMSSFVINIIK